jgi:hypothetical protein
MSRLFGRVVQVSVGQRGQPATLIEGLRIVFKIEKTLEKTPNNATIDIYNLSEKTRALFEEKNAAIRLTAGYEGSAKDIFIGDIAVATTKRAGPDLITSIEAADGMLSYQTKEADLSFAPGAKVGTILDQLTSAFGLTKGEIQGVNLNDQYLNGATFSGKVRDHIDTVIGKQPDLAWSIQDNQLQILPKSKGSTRQAVLLTPETGLVGSPFKRVVVNVDIAKKKEGKEQETGGTIKSLLNPELVPGRLVRVEAQFLKATQKIEKVTHQGDTHGVSFYSDVEGVNV